MSKSPKKKNSKSSISSTKTSTFDSPTTADFTATASTSSSNVEHSIIAYVHNLSIPKRNRGNTKDYCTLLLQISSEESREALLYSTIKRPLLLQSQETRTPIKITDYTYTADNQKIVFNDMTHITSPNQCEYSFQYAEVKSRKENPVTILEVFNSKKEWDVVKVKGKIINAELPRMVGSPRKRLKIMETVIADETGTIPLDLWETHIDQIEKGQVYELTNVQVRVWASRKNFQPPLQQILHQFKTLP